MRKLFSVILLTALILIIVATPVFAYLYRAPLTITETNGTSYTMLPVMTSASNEWMAANGFMESTALDTRVETLGGLTKPHLVTEEKTLTAIAVGANSQTNLQFTTGNTALTSMDIISGYGGLITREDAAALELGNNFEFEASGYIDTTAGASKDLVYKQDAFNISVDSAVTGTINANVNANVGSATLGLAATLYGGLTVRAGERIDNFPASTITSVSFNLFKTNAPTGLITINLRKVSDDSVIGTFGTMLAEDLTGAGVVYTFNTPVVNPATQNVRFTVEYAGGDAGNVVRIYHTNADSYTGSWTTFVAAYTDDATKDSTSFFSYTAVSLTQAGVTSGEHTVKVNAYTDISVTNDGVNQFTTGSDASLPAGANVRSIFEWVYLDTLKDYQSFFQYGSAVANQGFALSSHAGGDTNRLFVGAFFNNASTSSTGTIATGSWYHIGVTMDAGGNLTYYINGLPAGTATLAGYNTVANVYLVGDGWNANDNIDGLVDDVQVYARELGAAEVAANYALGRTGYYVPNNTANLVLRLKMDETSGVTATDTGSGGTNGTLTNGASFNNVSPLRLYIDSVLEDTATGATSVPDNANNWLLLRNNVAPYTDFYKHTVNGTLIAWYQPVTMIIEASASGTADAGSSATQIRDAVRTEADNYWNYARVTIVTTTDGLAPQGETAVCTDFVAATDDIQFSALTAAVDAGDTYTVIFGTLPDRQGAAQDAIIAWGANPTGIASSLGSMVSSGQTVLGDSVDTTPGDIIGVVGGQDWNQVPAVTGALLTNPLRPIIVAVSDNTTLTETQTWIWSGIAFVIFVLAVSARFCHGHLIIVGISTGVAIVACVVMSIFPLWALIITALAIFGGALSERSQSV